MRPPTTTFPSAHRLLLLNSSAGATSAAAARARPVAVAGAVLRLSTKTTTAAAAPQKLAAAATVTATTTTASALLRQLPHLTPTPTPTAAAAARLRLFTTAAGTSAPQPTSPQPQHHPHAPAPGDASSHFKLRRDAVATAAAAPPVVDDVPAKEDYMLFHPVYTPAELTSVEETHRALDGARSSVAFSLVTVVRFLFDKTTGYVDRVGVMTERQWLNRIVFLETIAGVPGFVAGMARHMRSLRLMRRDNGWIHTLIEEAENERMHLLTFLKLRKPSAVFRAMVLIAQGVFMNIFFACYLFSPKTCHRFVGYLEESAVHTYTLCLKDIEHGKISHWATTPAPDIAIGYWKLAPGATVKDVVAAVRADEATHRDVNHALSNLNADDPNPVA